MDESQKQISFKQAIASHKGMLHKICRIYQDNDIDRQDLMQEILLQLWNAFDSYKGKSALATWMYRVALNTAIMFFKKQQRRPDKAALPDQFDTADLSYNDTYESQLAVFYKAIKHLDDLDKALIILYMEDQPYTEIAASLGINEGNARTRISRAKNKLKLIIKEMNYEY